MVDHFESDKSNLERIPVRTEDYQLEALDQELLLYHPDRTQILYLNQSAGIIWNLCDGKRTIQEIILMLTAVYPENEGEVRRDVEETIEKFLKFGSILWI